MIRSHVWTLVAAGLAIALAAPAAAHHAQAPFFDQEKTVEVRGTVKSWLFRNPHPVLTVQVAGQDGQTVEWEVQFAPATVLARRGWTTETFQPGQEVIATGHPSRAPGTYGLEHRSLTWGDGSPIR